LTPIGGTLLLVGALLLLAIVAGKASGRVGLPGLIIFMLIGIAVGSEGVGGIEFDDANLAQSVGIVALSMILFSGGLDTRWSSVRPVLWQGIALSTVAVAFTATIVGGVAAWMLGLPLLKGLLLGAIVSSTDAAAVFSVMRSRGLGLAKRLRRILELESGSNDPMAVFLTVGLLTLIANPGYPFVSLIPMFLVQMGLGLLVGVALGHLAASIINRLDLAYDGLYPVYTLAVALFVYGVADTLGGNGFLAVYLAGMSMATHSFIHKRSVLRFHDGVGWLMQIVMFVVLGLLVYPSDLIQAAVPGLVIALVLVFVARPIGVFLTLRFSNLTTRELLMISWVGLRGAVPIVLATYPLVYGLEDADLIFNVVFFAVGLSVVLQSPLIPAVAKRLGVDEPVEPSTRYPLELEQTSALDSDLIEVRVPVRSVAIGKKILDLGFPEQALVVLIGRGRQFIVPRGATVIEADDKLLFLSDQDTVTKIRRIVEARS
jgi:cell volume regulation protein A